MVGWHHQLNGQEQTLRNGDKTVEPGALQSVGSQRDRTTTMCVKKIYTELCISLSELFKNVINKATNILNNCNFTKL